MSTFSQFLGGGGTAIGAYVVMQDAQALVSQSGQEFLKVGNVKAYTSDYALAAQIAPQLRVFGTLASTYGDATASNVYSKYFYLGTNYVRVGADTVVSYSATLSGLSTAPSTATGTTGAKTSTSAFGGGKAVGFGNGYMVVRSSVNTAPAYSTNGSSFAAVGGSFAAFPTPNAISYCGALGWLSLQKLDGTSSARGYIANVVPTGTWTVDTPASISMTDVYGIASNGTNIVVVGVSASATAGKLATATAVNSAFTDRTAASGITFTAGEAVIQVEWVGTNYVAMTSMGRVIISPDGITWTIATVVLETNGLSPVGTSGVATFLAGDMVTNGAGTVVISVTHTIHTQQRPLIYVSTDSGVSWATGQIFIGKHTQGTTQTAKSISLANGRFIGNVSGLPANFVDCGTLVTPDALGQQVQFAQGFSVRIK